MTRIKKKNGLLEINLILIQQGKPFEVKIDQ